MPSLRAQKFKSKILGVIPRKIFIVIPFCFADYQLFNIRWLHMPIDSTQAIQRHDKSYNDSTKWLLFNEYCWIATSRSIRRLVESNFDNDLTSYMIASHLSLTTNFRCHFDEWMFNEWLNVSESSLGTSMSTHAKQNNDLFFTPWLKTLGCSELLARENNQLFFSTREAVHQGTGV